MQVGKVDSGTCYNMDSPFSDSGLLRGRTSFPSNPWKVCHHLGPRGWHCGPQGKAPPAGLASHIRTPGLVLEPCFQSSSLLTHLAEQRTLTQVLRSLPPVCQAQKLFQATGQGPLRD